MFRQKYTVFFMFLAFFQTKVKSDFINAVNTSEILFPPKLFSKIQVRVIRKSGLYIPFYDVNLALQLRFKKGDFFNLNKNTGFANTCRGIPKIVSHKCLAAFCCVSLKDNKILGQIMSRSVYRYNVSLCYLCVSLTVSVVSVKRQEVTETAKSVTETSRTYRNFTMAVL